MMIMGAHRPIEVWAKGTSPLGGEHLSPAELDWKPPWTAFGPSLGVQIKTFSLRGFATYPLTRGLGFRLYVCSNCYLQSTYQNVENGVVWGS